MPRHSDSKPLNRTLRMLAVLMIAPVLLVGGTAGASAIAADAAREDLADMASYHLDRAETRTLADDLIIIADGDITIEGVLESIQPQEPGADGFSITLVSLRGDITVTGVIAGSSGVPGAPIEQAGDVIGENGGNAGDILLVAHQGAIRIGAGSLIEAGRGGSGGDASNLVDEAVQGSVEAGNAGRAGRVDLMAPAVAIEGATVVFGPAASGGNAFAFGAAWGGHGGEAGRIQIATMGMNQLVSPGIVEGEDGRVLTTQRFVGTPIRDMVDPTRILGPKTMCDTGSSAQGQDSNIDGGPGGCAVSQGEPPTEPRADDGSPGKDDTTVTGKCSHGGDGVDGAGGTPASATGGMGGYSSHGNGGAGGSATANGGAAQHGGNGGKGGHGGAYGDGCDGGDGGDGGSADALGGNGGPSRCAEGGAKGRGAATGGTLGKAGSGGTGGSKGTGKDGDDGEDGGEGSIGNATDDDGIDGTDGDPTSPQCIMPVGNVCDTIGGFTATLDTSCVTIPCDKDSDCEIGDPGNPCDEVDFFAALDTNGCIPPVDYGIVGEIVGALLDECDFAYFDTLTIADVCNGDVGGPDLGPVLSKVTRYFEAFA